MLDKIIFIFNFPVRFYRNWLVKLSLRLLKDLDLNMIKAHYPRYKRRQFWRDFVSSSQHNVSIRKVIGKTVKKRRIH